MQIDLALLKPPSDFSARAILTIDALAPLSMVAKMPGKYYRSQPEPSDLMLLGLLENALGWHLGSPERDTVLKYLEKRHKSRAGRSGVGYASLLHWHVRFTMRRIPDAMHYDDLWAQHLRGSSFAAGSRNYDRATIPLMNAKRRGDITTGDTADAGKDSALIRDFKSGDKVHLNVLRPHFPQYYASPTPREYVVPNGPYRYTVETSPEVAARLAAAIENPAAPLYLGSNDGWVEATWEPIT
jgi:CRISPR-associated protein Cas5